MSGNNHVTDLLGAHALGCLDAEEAHQVETHIATCAGCREELAAYECVAGGLAYTAPRADPPAGLKQRVLARVRPAAPRRPWWEALGSFFRRTAPIWGLATAVLLLALITTSVLLVQATRSQLPPNGMRVIALTDTDSAPGAAGILVVGPDGVEGSLVVDRLPPLDEEYQYQLWLIRDGQRTSGGVFAVDSHGYGLLYVDSPQPLSDYTSFGVTIEPAGGSPEPTGPQVLRVP